MARRRVKTTRPGGRAARVVAAVIDATMKEIARVGFAALRIEDVADIAGVAKTTVYRRWPTKAALVVEAMRSLHGSTDLPDTGTLRGDLQALLSELVRGANATTKRTLARAMLAAGAEPELAAELTAFRRERMRRWHTVLERAVKRGELARTVDVSLLTEVLTSPFALRVLRGDAIDRKSTEALIEIVLSGACSLGQKTRNAEPRSRMLAR